MSAVEFVVHGSSDNRYLHEVNMSSEISYRR